MGRSVFFGIPGYVWAALTLAVVALIEVARVQGINLPIPFLLLMIATIVPAGIGGLTVGIVSGLISAAYIVYSTLVMYGPSTLTGGFVQMASGMAIYFGTSVFVGYISRYQSQKFSLMKSEAKKLQNLVDARARQLSAAEQRFHDFAAASADWFWEMGPDLRFTWFSEDMEAKIGVPDAWCIGKTRDQLLHAAFSPDEWKSHKNDMQNRRPFRDFRYRSSGPGGEKWFSISGVPIHNSAGVFTGYRGVGSDVSRLVAAEDAAEKLRHYLSTAIADLQDSFVIWDADDNLLMCNKQFREANKNVAQFTTPGTPFKSFASAIVAQIPTLDTPQKRDAFLRDRLKQHYAPSGPIERQLPDGTTILIRETLLPDGGVVSIAMDITERRAVERRLMASQRLEAIGQLTGGVAHDFNNLLAVIQGNAELMGELTGETNEMLDAILRASAKGAVLTGQLLAFSRKQPLRPQAVNITTAVNELAKMTARTLGERIVMECRIDPNLWDAMIDPAQIDSVLMNLLINSRDAMPDGGNIVIECTNTTIDNDHASPAAEISPGNYVLLSVSDSGIGMSKKTLSRVFEPFFTTKEVGKGSGMGLSMVYGFAQQSGGHVTIYSEPGQGTTVNLYLPSTRTNSTATTIAEQPDEPRGAGETILVLEDDLDVQEIAMRTLEQLGYLVTGAANVDEARALFAAGFTCDLVLSDVIMPGPTSGPQFATEIAATHPALPFIYMSGFPEAAAKRNGFVGSDSVLLNKPFHRRDLAAAVRHALEAKTRKA